MLCLVCVIRSWGDNRVFIKTTLNKGKLWEAFASDERVVLLIDEIDKADIGFPNDLLMNSIKWNFCLKQAGNH